MEDTDYIEATTSTEVDGLQMDAWYDYEICGILSLEKEQFEYLIDRTKKQAKRMGWKKSYDLNFIFSQGNWLISSIGVYQLIKLNCELKTYEHIKEYENYFSEKALNDLIRYQGHKIKPKKKSKSESELAKEFKSQYIESPEHFKAKKISSSLKVPNLDIEDKSHLFYNKKVVITGTFEAFPQRKEMAKLIKSVGGDNNVSISSKTDYAIVGEGAGPSKLKKIKEHNTTVINESEFIELFKK